MNPSDVAPSGMVRVPGGTFLMGSNDGFPDESPVHEVGIEPFWLDAHEVTNAQFQSFVEATGYVTTAERPLDPRDFPDVPADKLLPGAAVFQEGKGWGYVPGANWRHPLGPKSDIRGKEDHPVVQVSWVDANAYAQWAGKRLPTEAEWEYAARAGEDHRFIWGNEAFDPGRPQANIWQGDFPVQNTKVDGYAGTAPVKKFKANSFGLYDMAGNVWEWCADRYREDAYSYGERGDNPSDPDMGSEPGNEEATLRVLRGGSFLCAEDSCTGYRPSARMKSTGNTGLSHTGFRCAKDLD